jgi:hypothetical protein
MFRLVATATVALVLAPGCRILIGDTDAPPDAAADAPLSPTCMEAETHSDLQFIEDKIFATSCVFSGCHNGSNTGNEGILNFKSGQSYPFLVNYASKIDTTRKLVVASKPNESYLLMMVQQIKPADMSPPASAPPANVGYMPSNAGGAVMCTPKREAIQRWIAAGAPAS